MTTKQRGLASNPLFDKTEQVNTTEAEGTPAQTQPEPEESPARMQPLAGRDLPGDHDTPEVAGQSQERPSATSTTPPGDLPAQPSTGLPVERPVDQSTSQSTSRSTRQLMQRPAAFYLFQDQSEALDDLILALRREHRLRTDRSALLRAVLTRPVLDYQDEANRAELIQRLLDQATDRMMSR